MFTRRMPGALILPFCGVFCLFLRCADLDFNESTLVPANVWGGFFNNVRLIRNGQVKDFPRSRMPIHTFQVGPGVSDRSGWMHSISFGPLDSVGFFYCYDSLPSTGQSFLCSLQIVPSSKPGHYYKNIDIYKMNSSGGTDLIHAPDSKILITGIVFDDTVPLYAADNGELVERSKITARHAISFVLSWSGDTLSGEMHWADYTGMRPPPSGWVGL